MNPLVSPNPNPLVSPNPTPLVSDNAYFTLTNPLSVNNFCDLIKSVLDIILAIGVPIAVLFIVWAGFRFVWARGNSEELKKARLNFMYVIIGIAVFLGAWTLATLIAGTIDTISGGSIKICGK